MVTIPIYLDHFYLPKKVYFVVFTFWKVYYSLKNCLHLNHGNWCMIITLKIDINFSSDLYRIKCFSCIKQFSINGITSLYNLPCYCNAVSPLWNSTVCMFIWLKHNDCGLFFLLFFLVKFMSARLEKCSTV